MGKLRYILFMLAALLAAERSSAAWRIVIDPKTLAVVAANMASQKLIEDQHNKRLDSIASKKQRLEQYTVSMATIKELYKLSLENINGFGTESMYYKEIGACALDIVTDIPSLFRTVGKAKFTNKLLCINELLEMGEETRQLVADFVNIVNNAKVENPLKVGKNPEKKSDGYNLLDRYERLTLANRIYTRLMELRYKAEALRAMAQYATLNDLCFAIDPEGWANVVSMKNQVDYLAIDWKMFRGNI